jgi:hypothetical protein
MKREVRTEIEIAAGAERVWGILSDFPAFPSWNPFVVRVEGRPEKGAVLKINVRLPDSRLLKFTPTVLVAEPNRELRWVGTVPLGAFRGEHFYIIEEIGDGRVRFVHGEHFSGWMVGLIWKLFGRSIERGYVLMNEAIKKEAEKQ